MQMVPPMIENQYQPTDLLLLAYNIFPIGYARSPLMWRSNLLPT